jgi:hypothetical protein
MGREHGGSIPLPDMSGLELLHCDVTLNRIPESANPCCNCLVDEIVSLGAGNATAEFYQGSC